MFGSSRRECAMPDLDWCAIGLGVGRRVALDRGDRPLCRAAESAGERKWPGKWDR